MAHLGTPARCQSVPARWQGVDDASILAKVESEPKFQMDEAAVPLPVQLLAYDKGVDCIRILAGTDETKAEVHKALRDESDAPQAEDLHGVTSLEDAEMDAYDAFMNPLP